MQARDDVTISRVYPSILDLIENLRDEADVVIDEEVVDPATGVVLQKAVHLKGHQLPHDVRELRKFFISSLEARWQGNLGSSMPEPIMNMYKAATALDPRYRADGNLYDLNQWDALKECVAVEAKKHWRVLWELLQKDVEKPQEAAVPASAGAAVSSSSTAGDGGSSLLPSTSSTANTQGGAPPAAPPPPTPPSSSRRCGIGKYRRVFSSLQEETTTTAAPTQGTQEGVVVTQAQGEIAKYFSDTNTGIALTEDPNVWWTDVREAYPILFLLSRLLHCIPASAAEVERLFFSKAGATLTNVRTSMDPERLHKMMVIQSNWRPQLYEGLEGEGLKGLEGYEATTITKSESNKRKSVSATERWAKKKSGGK